MEGNVVAFIAFDVHPEQFKTCTTLRTSVNLLFHYLLFLFIDS